MTTDMQEKPLRMVRPSRKLDIGAGDVRDEGWMRLDISPVYDPDIVWDITRAPWPVEAGSLDMIRMWHVLEHIERKDLVRVVNQAWRALGDGGRLWIEVPLFPTEDAIADPTHVSFFVSQTFDYFVKCEQHADDQQHRAVCRDVERKSYGIMPWAIEKRERVNHGRTLVLMMRKVGE